MNFLSLLIIATTLCVNSTETPQQLQQCQTDLLQLTHAYDLNDNEISEVYNMDGTLA